MKKTIKRNIPWLLTGVTLAGIFETGVKSAEAGIKAEMTIVKEEGKKGRELTAKEKVKATAPIFVSPTLLGLATALSAVKNTSYNMKNQALLVGAYQIVRNFSQDYISGVKDLYGEEAHQNVINHIVAHKVKEQDLYAYTWFEQSCLNFGDDEEEVEHLYYLPCADIFFVSTNRKVVEAELHLNRNFSLGGACTVLDFCELLGAKPKDEQKCKELGKIGWDWYNGDICHIDFNHIKRQDKSIAHPMCPDGIVRVIDTIFWPTLPYDEALYNE